MKNINKFLLGFMLVLLGQFSANSQACTLVCDGNQTINLDPGACEAIVSYNVTTEGNCGTPITGFTGDFDPANWTFTGVTGSSLNTAGAPASLVINGGNSFVGGDAELCITFSVDGDVSFDWNYTTTDSPFWDPMFITLNGTNIDGTSTFGGNNQSGSVAEAVVAGDVLCINQSTLDGFFGAGITTLSNFEFIPPFFTVVQTAGPASGEAFGIGSTTVTYELLDPNGDVDQTCSFTVTVNEYVPSSNDITCNTLVNISLDENCGAVLSADQILEGNNYGCYDNYEVTFADGPNEGQPVVLDGSHVNTTVSVMVTNPNGNSCWGNVFVEDKLPPLMTCYDVELDCTDPLPTVPAPDNSLSGTVEGIADGGNGGDVGGMVYLDITNNSAFPIDFSLDMNISAATMVDVYIIDDTYVGNTGNAAAWTLIGTLDATAGPFSGPFPGDGTLTPTTGSVSIPSGTYGLAIHTLSAANNYTNGANTFADGVISVTTGAASNTPFAAFSFSPRSFNGNFNYSQFFPAIPVVDACGPVDVTYEDEVQEMGCNGDFSEIITRTWTATDGSGNETTCVSTYSRRRATLETVSFPGDVTLDCSDDPNDVNLVGEPTGFDCGNIDYTTEEDIVIELCGDSKKILRKYVAIDWCTNTTAEHTQIIKLLDTDGPSITCPDDMTVGTSSNSCTGNVLLPNVSTSDNCSGVASVVFSSTVGTISNGMLTGLPLGTHEITVTATDGCENTSECTFEVTVIDNIAPIAICDEHTIASLGSDGNALISAATFDDGSHDNCEIVSIEARRMDNPNCPGFDGTAFGPTVPFSCCDLDAVVMVELRVTDASGNTNSCMVEVEVQDKLDPIIVCPANKTVDCTESTEPANTGVASASDNCGTPTVTHNDISNTIDDCGNGSITRVWTATDNGGRTASCIQIITVENDDPFTASDITWPLDYTVNTCGTGLDPEDLPSPYNYPTYDEGDCNNVAITHEDTQLEFGADDACLKILRKWIIIDWCEAVNNPDPTQAGPGVYHYTQIIKVLNSTDPVIESFTGPSVVENFDADCGATFASFSITASDDCTSQENLEFAWELSTGTSGTGQSAADAFANGSYSITFTVSDQCGNTSEHIHNFTVVDAKKPTPVCIFGIASTIMPSAGQVTIWATDFESGSSFDNCTAYEDLHFSFSPDINNTSLTITCDDVPADGLVPVTVYATDASGNYDFCTTFINVQDPNGACPNPAATISGVIETEFEEVVEEVTVNLNENNSVMGSVVTAVDGAFAFNMTNVTNYDIIPQKDINYLNGVSTYDLVLISKHILGVQLLDSPYKIIAADANNSGTVTTLDAIKLRALILHIDEELTNNTSWRFVDAAYDFVDSSNPLGEDFPEFIDLGNGSNPMTANFVALKVGDVNGSAQPSSLLGTDTRTFDGKLALQATTELVEAGTEFTVDFRASDFNEITGYQFTLGFDNTTVEFVDVATNLEGLSENNFGLTKLNEGVITTSWNVAKGVSVENGDVLFSVTFKANTTVNTSEVISLNSRYTASEAYAGNDLYDVVLEFNGTQTAGFELYQNTPNPFKEVTTIGFNMNEAGSVTLTVFDVSGRVLRLVEMDAVKGFNSLEVSKADLRATGVLYYQLETANETATKKMIIVE